MTTFTELAAKLRTLQTKRSEYENVIAEIKDAENKIKSALLLAMSASNPPIQNMRIEGVGTLSQRTISTARISDPEKLARFVKSLLQEAEAKGLPLSSALSVFQQRLNKGNILEFINQGKLESDIGCQIHEETNVVLTK